MIKITLPQEPQAAETQAMMLFRRTEHVSNVLMMAVETLRADYAGDADVSRRVARVLSKCHDDLEVINGEQLNYNLRGINGSE
jgi:hypothetical protein